MVRCKVSRDCYDADGLYVKAGGVAQVRRDAKGNLPEWAEPLEDAKPAKGKAEEKPPAK